MRGDKGSALILALVISLILMALALGLSMSSLADFSMSNEFEQHERALSTAEAGLVAVQRALRGTDITEAISSTRAATYFVEPVASPRDPVTFREARMVDYNNPPHAMGSIPLAGLMTQSLGVPFSRGRFMARVTDNDDDDGDPMIDLDGTFIVRVAGIEPGTPQELFQYGSTVKNSVVMIEAVFERDFTLDVSSPFSVYGPDVNPARSGFFDGNSFNLDGFDHSHLSIAETTQGHSHRPGDPAMAGLSTLNDDPLAGDAQRTLEEIHDDLTRNQQDNIEGADGPYGSTPSMRDDTETVRSSGNEDSTNLFNAYWLAMFIERVTAAADLTYPDGTELSGDEIRFGTEDDPKIVVAEGDLSLAGNGQGCGLLVVKGRLDYNGALNFSGLILVVGEGVADFGGANKSIIGGVYVANVSRDDNGDAYFGTSGFTLGGNTNFYFRGDSIKMALSLLPFKMLAWREITPEVEPAAAQAASLPDGGPGAGIGVN